MPIIYPNEPQLIEILITAGVPENEYDEWFWQHPVPGNAFGEEWENYTYCSLRREIDQSRVAELPQGWAFWVYAIPTDDPLPGWVRYWECIDQDMIPRAVPEARLTSIHEARIQRAYVSDCEVYAEVSWHPQYGKRSAIKGIEGIRRKKDLDLAYHGLRMVEEIEYARSGGRRTGSGQFADRDAFTAVVFPIIRALEFQGRKPTRENVCNALETDLPEYGVVSSNRDGHLSVRTLYNWFTGFGFKDWDDVVTQARSEL